MWKLLWRRPSETELIQMRPSIKILIIVDGRILFKNDVDNKIFLITRFFFFKFPQIPNLFTIRINEIISARTWKYHSGQRQRQKRNTQCAISKIIWWVKHSNPLVSNLLDGSNKVRRIRIGRCSSNVIDTKVINR